MITISISERLADGEEIKTPIGKVADLSWAADNRTIVFATEDDAKRSDKLWRYTLGDKKPAQVLEEKDELFSVSVNRSRDGKYLFLGSASSRTTEWSFLPADQPKAASPVLMTPRRNEVEYYPEHRDGLFYIRTNDGAKEFRVMTVPVATPGLAHWEEYLPTRPGVKIDDFAPFAKYAVVSEREAGLPQFRVLDFADKKSVRIPMPEPAYDASEDQNPEFGAASFRYSYESPVTPRSVYEYDFGTGEQKLIKQNEVLGGYDPAKYVVERVSVPGGRRNEDPARHRAPPRRAAGWQRSRVVVRVWVIRHFGRRVVFLDAGFAARARRGVRDRARARRGGVGRNVARRRPHDDKEEHVYRLYRVRRLPGAGAVHVARRAW